MANKNIPSLDGIIQPKGASRPDVMSQRGESPAREIQTNLQTAITQPAPTPAPQASAQPAPSAPAASAVKEPRAKSLTLRLSETQYQILRTFAFARNQSHQDIIEAALMEYIDRQERGA